MTHHPVAPNHPAPAPASRVGALALTAALAAALALTACSPSSPGSSGNRASRIVIGTTADVVNYNPLVGNSRTDRWITNLMYPSLMQIGTDGKKSPLVATEWGYTDGGRKATMKLRGDLKWSDGQPLTAKDVVFTIQAVAKEKIGIVAGLIPAFVSAEAKSDTEVEFTLSRPDGTFLPSVGFWMPIVPAHVFGGQASVQKFANDANWVSAGPYKLVKVEKGQRYVLDRVDGYPFAPGGRPTMEQVEFRVYPDVNTEVLALRNGDLDLIANVVPPTLAKSLEGIKSIKLQQVPSLGFAHVQYNTKRSPMDREEVRRALARAVNPDEIRRTVLQGNARSTGNSVLTPTLPFWQDPGLTEFGYDAADARKLLEQAGYQDGNGDKMYDGLSLEMIYDKADANISAWAQLVRDSSKEAGIDIKLAGLERNTYLQRANSRNFDIYAGSWAIMDEPPAYLALSFASGAFNNYAQVTDTELDEAIRKGQQALSNEDAKPFVQQAAKIVRDRVYDLVLYVETFNFAYQAAWRDFVVQPSELLSIVNPLSLCKVRKA